jgi:hypothetical protein
LATFVLLNSGGMKIASIVSPSAADLVMQSLLYREFKAEHEEILRHKWYESEKEGHDIGYDLAQVDWRIKHRTQWRKERQEENFYSTFEI